jgi:hypothetical protein
VIGISCILRDVSEQKWSERRLAEERTREVDHGSAGAPQPRPDI